MNEVIFITGFISGIVFSGCVIALVGAMGLCYVWIFGKEVEVNEVEVLVERKRQEDES